MRELLIATGNAGKLKEILEVMRDVPFKILTLAKVNGGDDVEETGMTLEENAVLKAKTYAMRTGTLTLAEDTGLEVEALGGRPGVFSARYGTDDADRNAKLLEELADISDEKRGAVFRTVAAIYDPERDLLRTAEGKCVGEILREPRGDKSFGYGPLFYADELGKTLSEADIDERNKVSHRGRAVAKAREILLREFI